MKVMSSFLDFMLDEDTATGALNKLQESMKTRSSGGNVFYRYKNLDYNATSTIRFLPASSEIAENDVKPDFWLDRKVIRLRFNDPMVEGGVVILPIPVMQMYKRGKTEDDIILRQVTPIYDEADKLKKAGREEEAKQVRAKASYHWHRGETIAQCFVVRSGFIEQDPPENPIRIVELNKQLMNVIKSTLHSDDPEEKLEFWPCHGKKGTNFVIKKTKSGDWPKYDAGSGFSRSGPTPWTTAQIEAIQQYGMFDLTNFLPPRPSEDEYKMLAHIVERSIAGVRIWEPDWEAHLENVKTYRTTQDGTPSEPADESLQVQVKDLASKLTGGPMTSAADVVSALSKTNPSLGANDPDELPETEPEAEPDVDEAEEPADARTASDVRSIVEKIKGRTGGKTATAG
jgi:hypothetical protein